MSVKLVSITQPRPGLGITTAEELITYVARVSNPKNQANIDTAPKLLGYLLENSHLSPFELVHMTLEITTSRGIAAQILRHRSFTFQEFSQRYSKVSKYQQYTARRQDKKNRQNSIDDLSEETINFFEDAQRQVWDLSYGMYNKALDAGIAKECARFLLPLNTETTMYMSGSIRSWLHYIQLRTGNGTQKEHMEIAESCRGIFIQLFPNIAYALGW